MDYWKSVKSSHKMHFDSQKSIEKNFLSILRHAWSLIHFTGRTIKDWPPTIFRRSVTADNCRRVLAAKKPPKNLSSKVSTKKSYGRWYLLRIYGSCFHQNFQKFPQFFPEEKRMEIPLKIHRQIFLQWYLVSQNAFWMKILPIAKNPIENM